MEAWRGWVDKSSPRSKPEHPHICFSRQSAVPDQWYFYIWDADFGPVLYKMSTYAPYGLWVMANGHEWAKRRLASKGVGFSELDNGLWKVDDPAAARRACSALGAGHLRGLLSRWLTVLPSPLTLADRRAGFDWSFSVRQLEVSHTAVFDRPAAGRAFFEAVIRDNIDLGRPDRVKVVFGRQVVLGPKHRTPGAFATGSGGRGESHPPAPRDPGVTVARHRALLTSFQNARTHCQWRNSPGTRVSSPAHHRLNRL